MTQEGPSRFKDRFSRIWSFSPSTETPKITPFTPQMTISNVFPTAIPLRSVNTHQASAQRPPSHIRSARAIVSTAPPPNDSHREHDSYLTYPVNLDDWASTPGPSSTRRSPPPPINLDVVRMAYPAKKAATGNPFDFTEPQPGVDFSVQAPAPRPIQDNATPCTISSGLVSVEDGHSYPSWNGKGVGPGEQTTRSSSRYVVEEPPLHEVALTPAFNRQRAAPAISSYSNSAPPRPSRPSVAHALSTAAKRGSQWFGKQAPKILPPLPGSARHVRFDHSWASSRQAGDAQASRRSPTWVAAVEWEVGTKHIDLKGIRARKAAELKKERMAKRVKWGIIAGLTVGTILMISLLAKFLSAKGASDAADPQGSGNSPSASPHPPFSTHNGSAVANQTAIAACLGQWSDEDTTAGSYPCGTCALTLSAAPNDFASETDDPTGVGAALQFCAFMDIYKSVRNRTALLAAGWTENRSVCTWNKTRCDHRQRVTSLILEGPSLPTTLPESLGNLVALQDLAIYGETEGSIPNGVFPTSVMSIPALSFFTMLDTQVIGPIKDWPQPPMSLYFLGLSNNPMLGDVLPDLSKTGITMLDATSQQLQVIDPARLPRKLRSLNLSSNNLTGPMPDFSTLTELKNLNLEGNNFTSMANAYPSSLTSLAFGNNLELEGELAPELCSRLVGCDLSGTKLTGPDGKAACGICSFSQN